MNNPTIIGSNPTDAVVIEVDVGDEAQIEVEVGVEVIVGNSSIFILKESITLVELSVSSNFITSTLN